jgi:hypothetical protein
VPGKKAEAPSADAQGYVALVTELKQRIADARLHAALSVNRELVLLYWGIGRDILVRQENERLVAGFDGSRRGSL